MTFLQKLLGNANVNDERMWGNFGTMSVAGEPVSFNAALKLSAYYAGIKLISDTIGALPKHVIERMPDDTRVQATDHYLYDKVHYQPNEEQTSSEFFSMMTANATMRNIAHALIVAGPTGFVDQLIPIAPERIRRVNLPDLSGYRYEVREGMQWKPYNKEDIFTLRFFQLDIAQNLDMLQVMQDTVGTSLATLKYRGRFFRNDASPAGTIEYPGKLGDKAYENLARSWHDAYSGGNQHKTAILESGAKYTKVGIDPKAAQLLESEEFNAEDVLRFIGVPPSLVGLPSRAVSWAGTGIEQQTLGFVTYNILSKLTHWKEAISKYLIIEPARYYVEFVLDGLLRGDSKTRYDVYKIGQELGMFTPNDLLRFENRNPRTDPGGDEYVKDMGRSLTPAPMPANQTQDAPPAEDGDGEDEDASNAHYKKLVLESAARLVRKEKAAMEKAYKRAKSHSDLDIEVREFYREHVGLVAQTLQISDEAAKGYCDLQAADGYLKHGAEWVSMSIHRLAALAMEAE